MLNKQLNQIKYLALLNIFPYKINTFSMIKSTTKIMIFGRPGSGKSTFALKLQEGLTPEASIDRLEKSSHAYAAAFPRSPGWVRKAGSSGVSPREKTWPDRKRQIGLGLSAPGSRSRI